MRSITLLLGGFFRVLQDVRGQDLRVVWGEVCVILRLHNAKWTKDVPGCRSSRG